MVGTTVGVQSRAADKRWSAFRSLYRTALRVRLKLWLHDYRAARVENIEGMQVTVLPGVFNGVLMRTGAFLATALNPDLIPHGAKVLDLGTGSGINALFAARLGAKVVATDISPEAVHCAQVNALANHLESQIETRLGDLFEPMGGDRFDVILFNPPYYRGPPRDLADAAWRSPDAFDRFMREVPSYLNAQGRALVVLSTDGDISDALWAARGLTVRAVKDHDFVNEILTVYEISRAEEQA
jgi:methylase of polypeptide subunit release factors